MSDYHLCRLWAWMMAANAVGWAALAPFWTVLYHAPWVSACYALVAVVSLGYSLAWRARAWNA